MRLGWPFQSMRAGTAWRPLGWASAAAGLGGEAAAATAPPAPAPQTLVHIAGVPAATCQSAVVFLPGDRVPTGDAECTLTVARLQQPTGVSRIMAAKFPGSAVLMALPRHSECGAALYHDFLQRPLSTQGIPPSFSPAGFPAAHALAALLAAGGLPAPGRALPPLAVLGFSKAGVVLHQLLVELAVWQEEMGSGCAVCTWQQQQQTHQQAAGPQQRASQQEQPAQAAMQTSSWQHSLASIRDIHFLDAGACSRGAAYPPHPEQLVAVLARRCAAHAVALHLHGTPRQWHDPRRRWLRREKERLVAAAAGGGVGPGLSCTLREYFVGEAPSMESHFATIEEFNPQG